MLSTRRKVKVLAVKIKRCIEHLEGRYFLEETISGEYVISYSLSNHEHGQIGPFETETKAREFFNSLKAEGK